MRGPFVAALVSLLAALACTGDPPPDAIPRPDLSGMEPQVAAFLEEARAGVAGDPSLATAWGRLGAAYDAHVLTDLAERCYMRAVELEPDSFDWNYLLAIVRESSGAASDEIVRRFDATARLGPDYAPLYVRLGDALWRRGSPSDAREALTRAIEIDAGSAVAHRRLGQVLLALDRTEEAGASFERAVRLEPADRAAWLGLGQTFRRLGRPDDARTMVEHAATLEPQDALNDPIYARLVADLSRNSTRAFNRAMDRIRAGDLDGAVRDLEWVRAARPDDASVHYWLGSCFRRQSRGDEALHHLGRAVEIDGNMVRARVELGRVLLERGSLDAARAQLGRALELRADPDVRALLDSVSESVQ